MSNGTNLNIRQMTAIIKYILNITSFSVMDEINFSGGGAYSGDDASGGNDAIGGGIAPPAVRVYGITNVKTGRFSNKLYHCNYKLPVQ